MQTDEKGKASTDPPWQADYLKAAYYSALFLLALWVNSTACRKLATEERTSFIVLLRCMSAVALSGAAALPVVVAAHASADFRSTWFPSLHGYLLHPYRVFVSSLFLAIVLLVGAERILWRREVDMDVGRAVSAAAAAALCLSAPSAFAYRPRQVEEEEGEMMPPGDNQTARFTVAPAGIVSPEALEILDTGVLVSLPLVILFCALLWIINSRPKGVNYKRLDDVVGGWEDDVFMWTGSVTLLVFGLSLLSAALEGAAESVLTNFRSPLLHAASDTVFSPFLCFAVALMPYLAMSSH